MAPAGGNLLRRGAQHRFGRVSDLWLLLVRAGIAASFVSLLTGVTVEVGGLGRTERQFDQDTPGDVRRAERSISCRRHIQALRLSTHAARENQSARSVLAGRTESSQADCDSSVFHRRGILWRWRKHP